MSQEPVNNQQQVNINFRLINMTTETFNLVETDKEGGNLDLNFDFQFGVNHERRFVKSVAKFKFNLEGTDIVDMAVSCEFEFEDKGWEFFVKGENIVLPAGLLNELAFFTLNTARGVLHAKTEGHKYNRMFLPMIGGQFVKDDLVIPITPVN
ncbi:hypothetical protein AB4865_06555 [Capnocytophaga sp. ARDL2]|uniref:hypothetical protein n=1 Tax=Capnocytophaga sp. ARDL2 TaxID=3238809 RepID=UPI0035566087